MDEALIIRIVIALALFAVYFIAAYLIAVKVYDESQYKWLVIALLQVGSLFSIKYLAKLVAKLSFASSWDNNTLLTNTFFGLLILNAAVILIMNIVLMVREVSIYKKKVADYKKVIGSSLTGKIRNMGVNSAGKAKSSIEEEETILTQIDGLIEDGRKEEAVKALREFISYASNKTTVDKATLMMRRLQTTMEEGAE